MSLKICFFSPESIESIRGGIGSYVRGLGRTLSEMGNDVTVISRSSGRLKDREILGMRVVDVPAPGPPILYMSNFFKNSARAFQDLHKGSGFDIIHDNLPYMSTFGLKNTADLPPIVQTVHTTAIGEARNFRYFSELHAGEFLAAALLPAYLAIESISVRRASVVVASNPQVGEEIRNLYTPRATILQIPTGVDTTFFNPRGALRERPRNILYLGRLVRRKGCLDLLRAFSKVASHMEDVTLSIVGSTDSRYGQMAIRFANSQPGSIRRRISFLGPAAYSLLPTLYSDADVYVIPSHYEGSPTTLLEAMASECLVVASRIPGIQEVISDGRSGILFDSGDVSMLTDALRKVLDNGDGIQSLAKEARKAVVAKHDWRVIASRIVDEAYSIALSQKV